MLIYQTEKPENLLFIHKKHELWIGKLPSSHLPEGPNPTLGESL